MYIIGGKHKKRRLFSPKSENVRPTAGQLREALFNICQFEIEGATFLDLFAGAGSMGLESLSRGASHAIFVEKNRSHGEIIKKNIALLKEEEQCTLLIMDVFDALRKFAKEKRHFDIIFADPPYGTKEHSFSNAVLEFVDQNPLLSPGGTLFLEDSEPASTYEKPLSSIKIVSVRKMGIAVLRQYSAL